MFDTTRWWSGGLCALLLGVTGLVSATDDRPSPESNGGAPSPGQSYQDRLIDPDIEPLPPAETLAAEDSGPPWLSGAGYRFGLREVDGSEVVEHGFQLGYQRDTTNYGLIRFEVFGRQDEISNGLLTGDEEGRHGHFTLTQTALPLSGGWFADNGLGLQRSASDPLIERSYRIYLPASIINGVTTVLHDDTRQWRFSWGKVGRLEGLYTRTFESEQVNLVGAGYSRSFGDQWRIATEFWLADPDGGESTRNVAGAMEYADPDTGSAHRFHLLTDDDGDFGLWYDGERFRGHWEHRFGVFSLAEGLQWQDNPILNNQDGLYYRGDYHSLSATYTVGLDAARSRDRHLFNYRLYTGASWRLGLEQRIGGQLSFGERELLSTSQDPTDKQRDYQFSVYYNHRVPWFDQRIEYQHLRDTGAFEQTTQRLRLDQFWRPGWLEGLATTLQLERGEEPGESLDELRAGVSYRYRFDNDLSLDTSLLWVRQDAPQGGAMTSGNATLALNWPINRHWSVGLNASYTNSQSPVFLAPAETAEIKGNQVFLSLAYSDSGGRPAQVLGAGSAAAGVGRLTGYVYFDENRDGRRSPGERGAAGVVVRLDGIVTTVTDAQGRYEFWPVAAGTHRVRVEETSVPLPWSPVQPLAVALEARGETYQDLALQRIDE